MRPWFLIAPLLFLLGCPTAGPSGDDDDSAAEPTPTPAPERVDQFLDGTSVFTFTNGQQAPAAPVLIHRVLDPADNSLTEDVYQVDEAGDVGHFEVVGVVDAAAGTWTFGFFDGYGNFEGEGTLVGEAWAWDAWSSRSAYVDGPYVGSYVLSDDRIVDGVLEVEKQIFSPDDHAEGTVQERLDLVTQAEWDAALKDLLAR